MVGLALYCYVLFYPQQRTEFRIFADALQLSLHNVLYILFHLIIVELYGGFHLRLVRRVVLKIGYQRNRLAKATSAPTPLAKFSALALPAAVTKS